MVIGLALAACGAAIALGVGRTFEEEETLVGTEGPTGFFPEPVRFRWLRVALPPLLLLFYAFAVERVGFVPTAAIMVATTCLAAGGTWRTTLVLTLCAPPAIHLVFSKLLRVPLAPGLLPMPW
jgi:putative tricarboxylic transport membrane protein